MAESLSKQVAIVGVDESDEIGIAEGKDYMMLHAEAARNALRDAGIGGQALVWFFISEQGRVLDKRIARSSGHEQLDDAALEVADIYEFTPALNRDKLVKVWVQIPITFRVR